MNPTAESQLKKHNLPATQQNIRQYTLGYAMILPSLFLTIWCLFPLKHLVRQTGIPYFADLIVFPMVFVLPGILCLLFLHKLPAFSRGLRDVMVLMVTILPIAVLGLGLKKLLILV